MPKAKTDSDVLLTYSGDAESNYISGVPARDLTEAEVKHLAERHGVNTAALIKELTESGLYARQED